MPLHFQEELMAAYNGPGWSHTDPEGEHVAGEVSLLRAFDKVRSMIAEFKQRRAPQTNASA